MRALIDPEGLRYSSLTHIPSTMTSGVLPIASRIVPPPRRSKAAAVSGTAPAAESAASACASPPSSLHRSHYSRLRPGTRGSCWGLFRLADYSWRETCQVTASGATRYSLSFDSASSDLGFGPPVSAFRTALTGCPGVAGRARFHAVALPWPDGIPVALNGQRLKASFTFALASFMCCPWTGHRGPLRAYAGCR
jgi:hypothetical protein